MQGEKKKRAKKDIYVRILRLLDEKKMNGVELAACTKLNYETLKKYLDGTNDIPEKKLKGVKPEVIPKEIENCPYLQNVS